MSEHKAIAVGTVIENTESTHQAVVTRIAVEWCSVDHKYVVFVDVWTSTGERMCFPLSRILTQLEKGQFVIVSEGGK